MYEYKSASDLDPVWRFGVNVKGVGSFVARVNAIDNTTVVASAGLGGRYQICEGMDHGDLIQTCEDEDVREILREPLGSEDECVTILTAKYSDDYFRSLYEEAREIEEAWKVQFGTDDCCVWSGMTKIVIDTREGGPGPTISHPKEMVGLRMPWCQRRLRDRATN